MPSEDKHIFGEFTLNLTHGCLYRGQEVCKLEPKPFHVLTYLVKNPYRLITKDELLDAVWGENHTGSEGSLVHCITAIRKVLGDEVKKKIVETKHTIGYRFNPDAATLATVDEKVIQDLEEGSAAACAIKESLQATDETHRISTPTEDLNGETQTETQVISELSLPVQKPDKELTPTQPTPQDEVQVTGGDLDQTTSEQTETEHSVPADALLGNAQMAAGSEDGRLVVDTNKKNYEDRSSTIENEFLYVAAIACPVAFLVFVCLKFGNDWGDESQTAFIQASLILGGVAYNLRQLIRFVKFDPAKDHVKIAVGQFQTFWTLLLVSWACLYFTWALGAESTQIRVLTTLLNNTNSLMLFLCYFVLNEPTVSTNEGREGFVEGDAGKKKTIPLLANLLKEVWKGPLKSGLITVGVLFLLEEIVILLLKKSPSGLTYTFFTFDTLSGMIGGITMALCISRLHSRFMGKSRWLPIVAVILYLYVVIQPLFVLINQTLPPPILIAGQSTEEALAKLPAPWPVILDLKPWIIELAFILKILMFFYVTQLIRRRRLLFYMKNAKRIYDYVEIQWNESESS